jgi:hypothetical protein
VLSTCFQHSRIGNLSTILQPVTQRNFAIRDFFDLVWFTRIYFQMLRGQLDNTERLMSEARKQKQN